MLICNLVMEQKRGITVSTANRCGDVQSTSQFEIRNDIWVITDKESGKYYGTFILEIPSSQSLPIFIKAKLEDSSIFSECFHSIRREYPKNDFEVSIFCSNEEKLSPFIKEAQFILKERNSQGLLYHYVNGPEEE